MTLLSDDPRLVKVFVDGDALFERLISTESPEVLTVLCSRLRMWDYTRWNFKPEVFNEAVSQGEVSASKIWERVMEHCLSKSVRLQVELDREIDGGVEDIDRCSRKAPSSP